jgi:hypothetical protein
MQKSNLSRKDTQNTLKDRVQKILKLSGFEHCFSEADFICFSRQTKGNFSQAFDISQMFIKENQNTVNDYTSIYEN